MRSPASAVTLGMFCALFGAALAAGPPVLEEATLRLFEQSDSAILPVTRRLYSTRFDATRMRVLGVEIAATHLASASAIEIPIDCRLQQPDASVTPSEQPLILALAAGATRSSGAALSWRTPGPAGWQPGAYAIRCGIDGQAVVESHFEVVENPPDVTGTDIRVAALRLFPVERMLPAKDDRRYAGTWVAAETNHIGVELEFTHAPLGHALTIPVECYYFWPDGQTSPAVMLSYEPQATWAGGYSAGAIGWDQPGHWLPGVYTVTCLIGGRPVIVDRFDLT